MVNFAKHFRRAVWLALEHDVLNTAKAAAYSGMLVIFPVLVLLTSLMAVLPQGPTLMGEIRAGFNQFLPADALAMMQASLQASHIRSVQLLLSATGISIFGGLGLMLSLMEGFRRAYRLPFNEWGMWQRRLRALLLVPIVLVPLALATLLLVFGRLIETWMILNSAHELRHIVIFLWRLARWGIAMLTSVAVLGALYHFGTRRTEHWMHVMPGAITTTLLWFPATLAFGWYVTRFADYSMVYGSFGAGIATLVWLYITSFGVLLGAELNGVLFRERKERDAAEEAAEADLFHL